MKIRINGNEREFKGSTVMDLFEVAGYDPKRSAVEINGSVVRRSDYGEHTVNEGDVVEIVSLVGGG
ncbi:MAG: sulfur carrier protein ThiS [Candidatus Methanomethylophilaceae archaeon]|nr:sulfur carrier protein ThiS [Candidatus Methanomethylophilaceae archaeon]